MTVPTSAAGARRLIWVVALIAAATLGFEISLMRMLLVAGYHHFAFLIITVALLGFGASGSALFLARRRVLKHGEQMVFVLAAMAGAAMPVCWTVAQHIPVEAVVVPATLTRQMACWAAYWAVLTIPFFLGAAALGLALMIAKGAIAGVYASNLIGSALGASAAPAAMCAVPPAWLPLAMGTIALIGAAGAPGVRLDRRVGALVTCAAVVLACIWVDPPHIRVDQFKAVAHLERLRAQGSADCVAETYGPRGVIAAYRSDAIHDLPFLAVGDIPPEMAALVIDGHRAGSVLNITGVDQASVVDRTLMAFPYAHLDGGAALDHAGRLRVLLLGEMGGTNVWLALRRRATTIDVVQPHDDVFTLMRGPLHDYGGSVLNLPTVRTTAAEPRHFIENTTDRFDLIQLVTLESLPAGSAGLAGLGEDHLITVEGIAACLRRLSADGVLAVSRGIQTPPRDNVKLLATIVQALKLIGIAEPQRHVVIVRDYLAVCTIVRSMPWMPTDIERVRRSCRDLQLTPVWFDGIEPGELNVPDQLPQAPDGVGDWYHYAAKHLFSQSAARFIKDWPFDIRAPTDDRPFFYDFGRLRTIGRLRRVFGDTWLTRVELGFLFVVAAAVFVTVVGAALTLLPLWVTRSAQACAGRGVTLAYFVAIGLAYLILELAYLSRLTHLIGDPVLAAAVTISGFLLLSGMGSLTVQRWSHRDMLVLRVVVAGLVVVGAVGLIALRGSGSLGGSLPVAMRCLIGFLAVAPVAYLMGFLMPLGLRRLERSAPALVPWAWGVNGFASVLAAPVAMLIGMTWGFHLAGIVALLLYGMAALIFGKLPSNPRAAPPPPRIVPAW